MFRWIKELILDFAIPRHRGCGGHIKRAGRRMVCMKCGNIHFSPDRAEEGHTVHEIAAE